MHSAANKELKEDSWRARLCHSRSASVVVKSPECSLYQVSHSKTFFFCFPLRLLVRVIKQLFGYYLATFWNIKQLKKKTCKN